ncbi:MAG: hypothetical protein ATN34_04840 [Epulopiscium sp. Nele67-Bin002]|nr:MAG: hypothetical protein ATN34_04840 [Epulopiscium sp. Nele67-Bin002]
MMRVKFNVAYKGTNYNGFAKQKDNIITIQGLLEQAIYELTQQVVTVIGSGRTDTGVHAINQVCLMDINTDAFHIPLNRFSRAMNAKLPNDIVVKHVEEASDDFHPRYDVKVKTYRYQILYDDYRDPFIDDVCYFYPYHLDIDRMKKGAQYIVGTHDFKCFCSANTQVKTTVRTIFKLDINLIKNVIQIDIAGSGFLYNMVRIIVGTLIEVGRGKMEPEFVEEIIASTNRDNAGPTAPAKGLTMYDVAYE